MPRINKFSSSPPLPDFYTNVPGFISRSSISFIYLPGNSRYGNVLSIYVFRWNFHFSKRKKSPLNHGMKHLIKICPLIFYFGFLLAITKEKNNLQKEIPFLISFTSKLDWPRVERVRYSISSLFCSFGRNFLIYTSYLYYYYYYYYYYYLFIIIIIIYWFYLIFLHFFSQSQRRRPIKET